MQLKNYGFVAPTINEKVDYVLGDGWFVSGVLMPNGHGWGKSLPGEEAQAKGDIDTFNCSNYGTLNCLEVLGKKKFSSSFQNNLSERYTGVMTGTRPNVGNDPHRVIEIIRTQCGAIPEVFLPFDKNVNTIEKYYSPKPMEYRWFAIGRSWLKKYRVTYAWVFLFNDTLAEKQRKMKDALQYSPLGVAGYAWDQHADGLYYGHPTMFNHWFMVYDYEEGKCWHAYDSYDKTYKKLDWNYNFGYSMMYGLDLRIGSNVLTEAPQSAYLSYIKYLIGNLFK
jgi:hypothetical protein